jgi:arsenate reductase (glutaredoxin)
MSALTVYTYTNCDSCRRATRWLRAASIAFDERAIRETPPTVGELSRMLAALGGERRKLCNTSGRDYRAAGLAERLLALSDGELLAILAANGNLIKRPFALGTGLRGQPVALVGFTEDAWSGALQAH